MCRLVEVLEIPTSCPICSYIVTASKGPQSGRAKGHDALFLSMMLAGCAIDLETDDVEVDEVSQGVFGANYSSCSTAGVYPSRVCLDWTTYCGPVIQIYTNNKVAYSFGIDASQTSGAFKGSWVNHPIEWVYVNGAMTAARHPTEYQFITVSGPNDRPNGVGMSAAHHDLLEWFSNLHYVFMTAY